MKKWFKSISTEQLGRYGIVVGIVGVVVSTAGDIIDRIRHDRRRQKLYATLQVKADEVSTNIFDALKMEEQSEES